MKRPTHKAVYKNIAFAEDFDRTWAEFKEEYETTDTFRFLEPKEREKELRKAFNIAKAGVKTANAGALPTPEPNPDLPAPAEND